MSINRTKPPVSDIIRRAATDATFRNLLLSDPNAALKGYTLNPQERAALSDAESVQAALDDWEAPIT
jgi:hypothetical protein